MAGFGIRVLDQALCSRLVDEIHTGNLAFLECESCNIALIYSMRNLYTVNSEFLNHSMHKSYDEENTNFPCNIIYFMLRSSRFPWVI
jgi:hypothetical protein